MPAGERAVPQSAPMAASDFYQLPAFFFLKNSASVTLLIELFLAQMVKMVKKRQSGQLECYRELHVQTRLSAFLYYFFFFFEAGY